MFPDFNIYSTPLLVLVIQGLLLALLLVYRFRSKSVASDIFLAILLLITCYHRTTYTIGFMSWYDTFKNTKINYYLISLGLASGPLIYFYIKASVEESFFFSKRDTLHFVPALLYVVFYIGVYLYDVRQPGFENTQNGVLYSWAMEHLTIGFSAFFTLQLFVYLVLSFKIYYVFRNRLVQEYSNTYNYELRWLRNFLIAYTFLFIYDVVQTITDGFILDLHWTEEWWYQFCSALVVIYVGVKGYFTPLENVKKINLSESYDSFKSDHTIDQFKYQEELDKVCRIIDLEKLYLDPNLSLSQLARKIGLNPTQLSFIINKGKGINFNDFINQYRVEHVKSQLVDPEKKHLTILSIAYDSGFNSKATFNRVFKRISGKSPSAFRNK